MSDGPGPVVTFLAPRREAGGPPWAEGDEVRVEGDAYRHLFRSRRMAVGESLRVVDGEGRALLGTVTAVDRRSARLQLGRGLPAQEPERAVHLVVGAPRPERASWLVEKVTELGVRSLTFVSTERTPREYGAGRFDRFRRVAIAALEQSHGARLPEIRGVIPWRDAVSPLPRGRRFVASPGAPPLPRVLDAEGGEAYLGEPSLWIGPEGGWSDTEIGELHALGGEPAGLGPGILRVETAGLVAAAVLLLCPLDLDPSA